MKWNELWDVINKSYQVIKNIYIYIYILKGIFTNFPSSQRWQPSTLRNVWRPANSRPKWTTFYAWLLIPSTCDSSLIHYGNSAKQLTKSTPHLWQVFSTNLGGLRPRNISQHYPPKVRRPSRSKGYWIPTYPQIQGCLEGHLLWPKGIKSHSLS